MCAIRLEVETPKGLDALIELESTIDLSAMYDEAESREVDLPTTSSMVTASWWLNEAIQK